jgi:hypothetical protein
MFTHVAFCRCECDVHGQHTNCDHADGTAISGPTLCVGVPSGVQGARDWQRWCHTTPPCYKVWRAGPANWGQFTHAKTDSLWHGQGSFTCTNKICLHVSLESVYILMGQDMSFKAYPVLTFEWCTSLWQVRLAFKLWYDKYMFKEIPLLNSRIWVIILP